ncbi:14086_t:CDS:1, partial [Racocetra persica]
LACILRLLNCHITDDLSVKRLFVKLVFRTTDSYMDPYSHGSQTIDLNSIQVGSFTEHTH